MLGSVLSTSLSGMSNAALAVRNASNNVANSQTVGYKATRVVLSDQRPRAASLGNSNGGNTAQVGLGVQAATIETDHTQGSILLSDRSLDLAIEGNGLFVLEGSGGERLYTRNGQFHVGGNGELLTAHGQRVLGQNVNQDFVIQEHQLEPIQLPANRLGTHSDLARFEVGDDGVIRGHFGDGVLRDLGRVQLARFTNPHGLERRENNTFAMSPSSGLPIDVHGDSARIIAGAREASNTDLAQEFVDLTRYETMFKANAHVASTASELLESLYHL